MDLLGASKEEFEQALRLIIERRRISQDLLKAHFGSSARATNMLSVLEMNKFITKPLGSERWHINFAKMERYLNDPNFIEESEEEEPIATDITIKSGSLPIVLKGLYLATRNFNIAKMLTTDLTITEIDASLETIGQFKDKYKNFIHQYNMLEAKQKALEEPTQNIEERIQSLKNTISSVGSPPFIVIYVIGLLILIAVGIYAKTEGILPIGVLVGGGMCIALVGLFFVMSAIKKENKNLFQLRMEKADFENTLEAMCDDKKKMEAEKEQLAKIYDLTRSAEPFLVIASSNRATELEDVLRKMRNILMDSQESQSKKILALEQFIYIIDKKYNDSIMLEEQQKATAYAQEQAQYAREQAEEARKLTQATRDVEEAIRKQTEFQAYVELMKDIKRENR